MLGLALGRQVTSANRAGVELVSWYWHFVDGVWVVVFTVVYLVGTVSAEVCKPGPRRDAMASDAENMATSPRPRPQPDSVEMPRPTAAPLVLALGLALLAAGVALGPGFLVVGAVVVVAGLSIWIVQLLPGRGHVHESLVEPARAPARDGRAGRRGAFAAGHARLPSAVAAGRSSRLRRPQGGHRRRRGDAGARPPLGTAERPRPLVSGQPPGRHRPAGRGADDGRRVGAVSTPRCWWWRLSFTS